jgi:hypothetical protein
MRASGMGSEFQAKIADTLRVLEGLREGDLVRLIWHDASHTSRDSSIAPRFYVTKKEAVGSFGGLKRDPSSPMLYVILITEKTDGQPTEYDSIPLGCIEDISTMRAHKTTLKAEKKERKSGEVVKTVFVVQKVAIA